MEAQMRAGQERTKPRERTCTKSPPSKCKPFVKWAGGKGQLLKQLLVRLPEKYNRYFEPFVGGGALFFELKPGHAYLSDTNAELINCYRVIKDRVSELIEDLSQHTYEHDYFYSIRNVDREPEFESWNEVKRASRFIYLNKTCFNGLYRVNAKGYFNVPFGRYKNPKIVDTENLYACHHALRNARLSVGSFAGIEQVVRKGDLVYFDPPYAPLNATSYFTSYTENGFGETEQRELASFCRTLDRKGVYFMLSNSHIPLMKELYQSFNISVVGASRAINSKADRRGQVEEIIATNY